MEAAKKQNILIVDDLAENIDFLVEILKKDYNLKAALNGERAIEIALKDESLDLILLDVMMPGLSGFEVCKELRSNDKTKKIPIIFLTAKNDTSDIVSGFELGAQDYVTKPFNSLELLERVKTHIGLKVAREQLEQVNQDKNKLFSIVAHDLSNPLNIINCSIELLALEFNKLNDDEKRTSVLEIKAELAKMTSILRNFFSWSRSQLDTLTVNKKEVNANTILTEIEEEVSIHLKRKNITFIKPEIKEGTFFADYNMSKIIFRNIINNAVKFTRPDGTITISSQKDKQFLQINIKDDGVGMSEEMMQKLFSINQTESRRGTGGEKGSGLGLILCKDFLERNGGKIDIESTVGEGTQMSLFFPLK